MHIQSSGQVHSAQAINAPHRAPSVRPAASAAPASVSGVDQLDISPEADLVSRARDLPDIRQDLVARIRSEIQSGSYETDEKLDYALGALLDEIGG